MLAVFANNHPLAESVRSVLVGVRGVSMTAVTFIYILDQGLAVAGGGRDHLVGVLMLAFLQAVHPDLQVVHTQTTQRMAAGTQVAEYQIHSVQRVGFSALVGTLIVVLVQGSDLDIVDQQPGHIAAVLGYSVFNAVGMLFAAVYLDVGSAVVEVSAVASVTEAQEVALRTAIQILDTLRRSRIRAGDYHILVAVAGCLPLDDPFRIVGQGQCFLHLEGGAVEGAVTDGTSDRTQIVLGKQIAHYAGQAVSVLVQLPADGVQLAGLVRVAELAVLTLLVLGNIPLTVNVVAQLAVGLGVAVTALTAGVSEVTLIGAVAQGLNTFPEGMGMGAVTLLPDLGVFHSRVQRVSAAVVSAQMGEGQRQTVQPIHRGIGGRGDIVEFVHRADLGTVHIQVSHIAAVFVYLVYNAVGMQIRAVQTIHAVVLVAAVVLAEEPGLVGGIVVHIGGAALIVQQHPLAGAGCAPLDGPVILGLQLQRLCQLVGGTLEGAARNGACHSGGQRVGVDAAGGHIHKTGLGIVQLPAIDIDFLSLHFAAVLTDTLQIAIALLAPGAEHVLMLAVSLGVDLQVLQVGIQLEAAGRAQVVDGQGLTVQPVVDLVAVGAACVVLIQGAHLGAVDQQVGHIGAVGIYTVFNAEDVALAQIHGLAHIMNTVVQIAAAASGAEAQEFTVITEVQILRARVAGVGGACHHHMLVDARCLPLQDPRFRGFQGHRIRQAVDRAGQLAAVIGAGNSGNGIFGKLFGLDAGQIAGLSAELPTVVQHFLRLGLSAAGTLSLQLAVYLKPFGVGMGMGGCASGVDLQVFQACAQLMAGSAQMIEYQSLAVEPILCDVLVGQVLVMLVHRTDFHSVHEQIRHIAAVRVHTVFDPVGMDCVGSQAVRAEVLIQRTVVVTEEVTHIGHVEQIGLLLIGGNRAVGQQLMIRAAAAAPFDDPFIRRQQCYRLLHRVNRAGNGAARNGARGNRGQRVGAVAAGGDVHQGILGLVHLPAVIQDLLGLLLTADRTFTAQDTLGLIPGGIRMTQFLCGLGVGFAAVTGIGHEARFLTGALLGIGHHICVLMVAALGADLQVFQVHIVPAEAVGAQVLEGEGLAADPVIGGRGIGTVVVHRIHRADLHIVDHQICHIAAVGCHTVLNTEGMGLGHIHLEVGNTVVDITARHLTEAKEITAVSVIDVLIVFAIRLLYTGQQHIMAGIVAGGLPLDDPFVAGVQDDGIFQRVDRAAVDTVCNGTSYLGNGVRGIAIGGDIHQAVLGFVQLPAVVQDILCFLLTAGAFTAHLTVGDGPVAVLMGMVILTVDPDLQVFQAGVIQIEAGAGTDIPEGHFQTVQGIVNGILVGAAVVVLIHRADFFAVQDQVDHIAAVGCHTVFQTVSMDRIGIGDIMNTIILEAVGIDTKAQERAAGSVIQILGIGGGGILVACHDHILVAALCLPLHHPFLGGVQSNRFRHLQNTAACQIASDGGDGIFPVAVGGDADQGLVILGSLPTVVQDLFGLLLFAERTGAAHRAVAVIRPGGMLVGMVIHAHRVDLQVLQISAELMAVSAQVVEGQGLAAEPIFSCLLVADIFVVLVHRTDFYAVNIQIRHIAAIRVDTVYDPVGMHHIGGQAIYTEVFVQTAVVVAEEVAHIGNVEQVGRILRSGGLTVSQQLGSRGAAAAPLNDPLVGGLQGGCLRHLEDGAGEGAVRNGTCHGGGQVILLEAVGGHADQSVLGFVQLPAVVDHFLGLHLAADGAFTGDLAFFLLYPGGEVMGMLVRASGIDFQIFQAGVFQGEAAVGADVLEGQRLAVQPVVGGGLVGTALVILIHRADFHTVNEHIDHIGAVGIHTVLQTVHLHLVHLGQVLDAVIVIGIVGSVAEAQEVAGLVEQVLGAVIAAVIGIGNHHKLIRDGGLPLDHPVIRGQQGEFLCHLQNTVAAQAALMPADGILRKAAGGHADKAVLGIVQLPAVVEHLLGLLGAAVLTLVVQNTVNGHGRTKVMPLLGQAHLIGSIAFLTGVYLIAAFLTGCRLGTGLLIAMDMTVRGILVDLEVGQIDALHRMAAGAQMTEGKGLAADPVVHRCGIHTGIVLNVQGADLDTVDHQIGHIGAVGCHAVFDPVGMFRGHIAELGNTEVLIRAADPAAKAQEVAVGADVQIMNAVLGGVGAAGQQHILAVITAGLPLDAPALAGLQLHCLLQGVNGGTLGAAGDTAGILGQRVGGKAFAAHIHQRVLFRVQFPTVGYAVVFLGDRGPGRGNGDRAGHVGNGDLAVLIARLGNILAAHRDLDRGHIALCHSQRGGVLAALEGQHRLAAGCHIGQVIGNVIDCQFLVVFLAQHRVDNTLRNAVHSLGVGVKGVGHTDAVVLSLSGNAFQLHKGQTQRFCRCLQFVVGRGQIVVDLIAGHRAQAEDLRVGITNHSLMQHNGISLAYCGGVGIGILAVGTLYKQGILVNGRTGTPGQRMTGVVIGAQVDPDIVRLFALVIMQLDTAVLICRGTGTVLRDPAAGPGVVHTQLHSQGIDGLLPPGIVPIHTVFAGAVKDRVTADGGIITGIVGYAGVGRDTVAQDRYLLTRKVFQRYGRFLICRFLLCFDLLRRCRCFRLGYFRLGYFRFGRFRNGCFRGLRMRMVVVFRGVCRGHNSGHQAKHKRKGQHKADKTFYALVQFPHSYFFAKLHFFNAYIIDSNPSIVKIRPFLEDYSRKGLFALKLPYQAYRASPKGGSVALI